MSWHDSSTSCLFDEAKYYRGPNITISDALSLSPLELGSWGIDRVKLQDGAVQNGGVMGYRTHTKIHQSWNYPALL